VQIGRSRSASRYDLFLIPHGGGGGLDQGDVVTAEKNAAEGLDLKESGCSEHAVHDEGKACMGNKQPLWCACQLLALGPV
jgi:hypothetical protein